MGVLTTILIVTYHALDLQRSPISVPASELETNLSALSDAGFVFVTLDQCADWLEGRISLPDRCAAITFDDGYASVAQDGLATLHRHQVPAAVFVIAGRIGGDNQWTGQSRQVATMPLAGPAEIDAFLAAGMTIGSHSLTHAAMPSLTDGVLADEVNQSADRLEALTGVPVRHFSYPYGRRGPREVAAVRQRYRTAVTTACRLVDAGADPHDLPRIDAHDLAIAIRFGLLNARSMAPYLDVRRALRRARRFAERFIGVGWEGLR